MDEEFFAAGKPCFGCDQEFFPEGNIKRVASAVGEGSIAVAFGQQVLQQ